MSEVILSIITINLNNKAGLEETISSVINQNIQDFEWIIIDGGSKDGSLEILNEYNQHFDYFISETDNGIYDAMNKGIKQAHGTYLFFLNSGDRLYSENVISEVLPRLHSSDFYVGIEMSEFGKKELKSINKLFIYYYLMFKSLPHQATFIKKTVFDRFGLYDENYKIISDWLLTVNSLIIGDATISTINTKICYYNQKGISNTNNELRSAERLKSMKSLSLPLVPLLFSSLYKFKAIFIDNNPKLYRIYIKFNELIYNLLRKTYILQLLKKCYKSNNSH